MDHRPKCKFKTVKFLEDNIGENLDDLWLANDFLDTTSKTWSMKEIIDKQDFNKIENFYSVKNTVKKRRRGV